MGLHREPDDGEDIPFFLQECRRKVFAAAYRSDKTLATFLGRPLRLPSQYSDIRPPLDISDESLVVEGQTLDAVLLSVKKNGWNTQRQIWLAGFIRVRYIMSAFREEIPEICLGNRSINVIDKLK